MPRPFSRSAPQQRNSSGVEFLEAAARACPHGLMVEQDGCIVYANPAYARAMGFPDTVSVLGKRVADLPLPQHSPGAGHGPEGNGNGNGNGNGAAEFDTLRLQFRHHGRPLALSVVRDVSERKRLEQRLRESEKMEALGRLVGGVAHDFNNLLTAITLYSDLLLEQAPRPPRREAEEIHLAAERGAALVRQLLAFARQQPMAPRTVSMREIVISMRGMLQPLLGEDVELTTDFAESQDAVRLDPAQMQQVILNLVMNARDAMPKGGRLHIATGRMSLTSRSARRYPRLRPGCYVTFSISDTGCGMDEQVRARLFEPFFTTKGHGQGTGLGMAMVYGIVTQSGGGITVNSRPGKGTRITVLLPCAAGATQAIVTTPVATVPSGTETVLVLEDDSGVRRSIAHLLTHSGYQVLQARNGQQALAAAREHAGPIHLLLSDLVMPGFSGWEAARKLRHLHPETRVLFISGYPPRSGAPLADTPVLFKPFSRAVLAQKVREVLDRRAPALAGGR